MIVLIQFIKLEKNINIQSSKLGKIKTIVMSITVIIVYIVTDINKLSFLGNNIIDFINNINSNILYGIIFIPLYIFEVLSLYSYLKFLKTYDSNKKVVLPPINISLKPKTTLKNRFDNFCTIWLNNEFYE